MNTRQFLIQRDGFTLLELQVVIASVAFLGAIFLPALSKEEAQTQALQCTANIRNLNRAWTMYVAENGDRLPPFGAQPNRVWNGDVHFGTGGYAGMTNTEAIKTGLIWKYYENLSTTVDPSSPPWPPGAEVQVKRVRSYSIDGMMNQGGANNSPTGMFTPQRLRPPWTTMSAIKFPGPSAAISILCDNEWQIDDARFLEEPGFYNTPTRTADRWRNIPGTRHGAAGIMGFADGHTELWKWVEPSTYGYKRTIAEINTAGFAPNFVPPKGYLDVDLARYSIHTLDVKEYDKAVLGYND